MEASIRDFCSTGGEPTVGLGRSSAAGFGLAAALLRCGFGADATRPRSRRGTGGPQGFALCAAVLPPPPSPPVLGSSISLRPTSVLFTGSMDDFDSRAHGLAFAPLRLYFPTALHECAHDRRKGSEKTVLNYLELLVLAASATCRRLLPGTMVGRDPFFLAGIIGPALVLPVAALDPLARQSIDVHCG